ncbi:hypothetical protein [Herbaspirillum sp.]|uniref:hypothetical protein n=1 Tax=Herbaspirillum sp. TaxID=1890675 RepID=UPI000C0C9245|nr:hypothetical protein [Herbaspirillum sp.]MBO18893.1 hypothetical protein [Herbaspirillum sp.]|tara:strand:- start:2210 stop:2431 length:222 start_codon:yes stop_codon:yes gene_type:complete
MIGRGWWRPLLTLRAEHLALVRREGLLEHLNERSTAYRHAAEGTDNDDARRELMRRAAILREAFVALDQAAGA